MEKLLYFFFGILIYILTLGTFAGFILFEGNIGPGPNLDGMAKKPILIAVFIDIALILVFAALHSIMARQWFKKWWTRFIPKPLERSVYCLVTCLCLWLLMVHWEPMPGTIWNVQNAYGATFIYTWYFAGWTIVFTSSALINHWDLFGIRQVFLHLLNKPYTALNLEKPLFYRRVRHPLYLGFLITFWASPIMNTAHFIFALLLTFYVLKAIRLEERDLIADFGERYLTYQKEVPMIFPVFKKREKLPEF